MSGVAALPNDLRQISSYVPYWLTLKDGSEKTVSAEVLINMDGSIHVSDWDALEWWRDQFVEPTYPEFAIVTLLFAARGRIREVSREEALRIAERAAREFPSANAV